MYTSQFSCEDTGAIEDPSLDLAKLTRDTLVGRSLRFDATAGRELKVAPRLADYVKMAATPDAWLVLQSNKTRN